MFFGTLFIMMEQEIIDGIIRTRIDESYLPDTIETPKRVYSYQSIASHEDLYLIKWHLNMLFSTVGYTFFISHESARSLHETSYNGVQLFIFPFFGDQPPNSRSTERAGVRSYMDNSNLKYDAKDYENFYEKVYRVAVDPENKSQIQ